MVSMEKDEYVVIGGQYHNIYYGCTSTLQGAKRLATKNGEYWDNYAGKQIPKIYNIYDTIEIDGVRYPKHYGCPYYTKLGGKWELVNMG